MIETEIVGYVVWCAVVGHEEDGQLACGVEIGGACYRQLKADDSFGAVVFVADPGVGAIAFAADGYSPVVDAAV